MNPASPLQPMALVSWGCVLGVRWVEPEELRQWISSHALHTPTTAEITSDGVYEDGLFPVIFTWMGFKL